MMFAAAAVAMVSCADELVQPQQPVDGQEITIFAGVDNGADTKVTFTDDDANRKVVVNWKESGEAFTAYIDGTKVDFSQASKPVGGKAYFSGTYDGTPTGTEVIQALYPVTESAANKVLVDLNNQSGKERDEKHTYMYAVSTLADVQASGLTFHHINSILKVTMSFPAGVSGMVENVQFVATDLLSKAEINVTGETPTVHWTHLKGSIALNGDFQIEGGKAVVYLHVLPGTLSDLRISATVNGTAYSAMIGGRSGGKAMEAGKQYGISADMLDMTDMYVTVAGGGDGSSWESATTLTNALALAGEGSTVHVAAGTYVPETALPYSASDLSLDAYKGFGIYNNITVIGGYPENPAAGAVADPAVNKTILDGQSTSYHVLVVAAQKEEGKKVVIKGITVQNGNANAAASGNEDNTNLKRNMIVDGASKVVQFDGNRGGGMAVMYTALNLENVTITNNKGTNAAGIYALNNDIEMNRCIITKNSGTNDSAGLITAESSQTSTVVMSYCDVTENTSTALDHGNLELYGNGGTLNFTADNSRFNKNTANKGGAVFVQECNAVFNNCVLSNNKGQNGGVLYLKYATTEFESCTIAENDGNGGSGNIYIEHYGKNINSSTIIKNSVIRKNVNCSNGSAIYAYINGTNRGNLDLYVMNSAIIENGNSNKSRPIFLRNKDANHTLTADFVNTTFAGNMANYGAAVGWSANGAGAKMVSNIIGCTIANNKNSNTSGNLGALFYEGNGNAYDDLTINIYNSVISGNVNGTDAGDIWSKNTASKAKYYSSILGDKYYNAAGTETTVTPAFDFASMLGSLEAIGSTWGCKLVAGSNPAVSNGSTAAELEALADETVTAEILKADQTGAARTGRVMGAIVTL